MLIKDLNFNYGQKMIFNGLNIRTDSRIVCLMGPSGCGKTTLLHLIAGLLKPSSGTIEGLPQPCALMFQEDRLLEWTDAFTNVNLVLEGKDGGEPERILESLGIDPRMGIKRMSGGMKRRVALARALAFKAPTLLLDEPFKGLDEDLMIKCAAIVRDAGRITVVSTHSVEEAQALGAEIIHLA